MKLIKNIPGPLLIFLGAFCLSFGGLIVKSFESANLWQILFWRQFFFSNHCSFVFTYYLQKKFFSVFL